MGSDPEGDSDIYPLLETPISKKHPPDESETKAGQSALKLLIKSGPPERETRTRDPGKHRGNRIGKI
ncbi:predicted protein [Streptomyces viridosporus ATCC 14672]|uniref:Predicted protein n=1 Tax=Streptomyces viridosporus (strain ATCC 14672 / DSM 40746 / JCM 4963 / KCTC 9882 / NRRL B-12104 / FH 1290) TaxID=566461 RepID=D5ZZ48_STRV1|nr:predicted protein [Streptomyces viridosporus ATCC 14672]